MSFFGLQPKPKDRVQAEPHALTATGPEVFYRDLIAHRPSLLDEKLKLHERIIDDFNLTLLEKLSPEELLKQVRSYVGNYVRTEKIPLNQKGLDMFTDEILNEMTGFGPIEPLLKDPT